MADFCYTKGLQAFMNGEIDLDTDVIKALLCTADYTPVAGTDDSLDDIPAGARVAEVTLAGVTITDGVFDANDSVFPAVAAGDTVTQIIIYKSGSPTRLLRRIDSATGLPFTTNGLDINLAWPNDANKIFRFVPTS
jgi:hypothetical protein